MENGRERINHGARDLANLDIFVQQAVSGQLKSLADMRISTARLGVAVLYVLLQGTTHGNQQR
jgi:hypothetical protein